MMTVGELSDGRIGQLGQLNKESLSNDELLLEIHKWNHWSIPSTSITYIPI